MIKPTDDDLFAKYGLQPPPKPKGDKRAEALRRAAERLGVDPVDLGAVISFESAGSFDPHKVGGEGNRYKGLIQFGPEEQKQYYKPNDTFETQVEDGVVRFLQDRFKKVGKKTQGASLEDIYTTIIAGNPNANRNAKDSFGTSARSGAARIAKEHRPQVLQNFFGGVAPSSAPTTDLFSKYGLSETQEASTDLFSKYRLTEEPTPPMAKDLLKNVNPVGPTQPPASPTIQGQPIAPPVMPESPQTIQAQTMSVLDANSPRTAVLFNTPEQEMSVDPSMLTGFIRLKTPNGTLVVNPAKAKALGITNIPQYVAKNGFAKLIGKATDVGNNTGGGLAVVTLAPDGTELSSSIVKGPEDAARQADIDRRSFPNVPVTQKLVTSQDVVNGRQEQMIRQQTTQGATGPVMDMPAEDVAIEEQPIQTLGGTEVDTSETATLEQSPENEYQQWLAKNQYQDSKAARESFAIEQQATSREGQVQYETPVQQGQPRQAVQQKQTPQQQAAQTPQTPDESVYAVAEFTKSSGNARKQALDSVASQLASKIGVDYDRVRQRLERDNFAEGSFTDEVAERKRQSKEQLQIGLDANAVRELKEEQAAFNTKKAKADTNYQERLAKIDPNLSAEDRSLEEMRQRGLADLDEGLRSAVEVTETYESEKKALEEWKKQNPEATDDQIRRRAAMFGSLGNDRFTSADERKARQESYAKLFRSQFAEEREASRQKAIKEYGSLAGWKKDQEKAEKEFNNLGKNTSPLFAAIVSGGRKVEALAGGAARAVPEGVAAISESIAIASEAIDKALGVNDTAATERATFKFGQDLRKLADEYIKIHKDEKDGLVQQAGNVFGQIALMVGTGGASALASGSAKVGALVGAGMAGSLGGAAQYTEATDVMRQNLINRGMTKEQADAELKKSNWVRLGASGAGFVLSASDYFLMRGVLGAAKGAERIGFLKNFKDTIKNGLISKGVIRSEADKIAMKATDAVATSKVKTGLTYAQAGAFEALQESVLEAKGNDLYAYMTYDQTPERKAQLLSYTDENQVEGVMGFLGGLFGKKVGKIAQELQSKSDDAVKQIADALRYVPQAPKDISAAVMAEAKKRNITVKPAAKDMSIKSENIDTSTPSVDTIDITYTDKQGRKFELVEDKGDQVLVRNEKGGIVVRNKKGLTEVEAETQTEVSESKSPVVETALAKDTDVEVPVADVSVDDRIEIDDKGRRRWKRNDEVQDVDLTKPQKFTFNPRNLDLELAPRIDPDRIDWEDTLGGSAEGVQILKDLKEVRVLELRGVNADGKPVGTIMVEGENGSIKIEGFFKPPASASETVTDTKASEALASDKTAAQSKAVTPDLPRTPESERVKPFFKDRVTGLEVAPLKGQEQKADPALTNLPKSSEQKVDPAKVISAKSSEQKGVQPSDTDVVQSDAPSRGKHTITQPVAPIQKAQLGKALKRRYEWDGAIMTIPQMLEKGIFVGKSVQQGGTFNRREYNRTQDQEKYERDLAAKQIFHLDAADGSSMEVPKSVYDAVSFDDTRPVESPAKPSDESGAKKPIAEVRAERKAKIEEGKKQPRKKRLATIQTEMKDEFRARRKDGREMPDALKSASLRNDQAFEKALNKFVDKMSDPFIRDWHSTIFDKDTSLRQSADDFFSTLPDDAEIELLDSDTDINASGESGASAEAMSRLRSEKAQGTQRVVVNVNNPTEERRLIDAEGVDYVPRPNEVVFFRGGNRDGEIIDRGSKAGWFVPKPEETGLRQAVSDNKNLVVAHNLSEANLRFTNKLGALAMPSLAITKADTSFTGFGEITLLADKSLIDPKAKVPVTDADMYSPRYPSQVILVKHNALKDIWTEAVETYKKAFPTENEPMSHYVIEAALADNGLDGLSREPAFQVQYLVDNGITIPKERRDLYTVVDEHRDGIDDWASEVVDQVGGEYKFRKGYTNSGNRRHGDYTLDAVVKHIKSQMKQGEGWNYGAGSIRATAAKRFKSIAEIQKDRNRIVSTKDIEATKEQMQNKLFEVADDAKQFYKYDKDRFGYYDDFSEAIADGLKAKNLRRTLEEYGWEGIDMQPVIEYVETLRNQPTEYFEAKPQRAVRLNEFVAAVVPTGISEQSRKILERADLEIVEYQRGDDQDRVRAVKEASEKTNALFKLADDQSRDYVQELRKAHPADLMDKAASRIVDGELEVNEEAGELVVRLEESILGKPRSAAFGVTYPASMLKRMARAARSKAKQFKDAGYKNTKVLNDLADNLEALGDRPGIVYTFEDSLPEERFHRDDLEAGRVDKDTQKLLMPVIKPFVDSAQFKREGYGDLNDADKISEVVAKLFTGQEQKYDWDKIPGFQAKRAKIFRIWLDGIIAKNQAAIAKDGLGQFLDKFKHIGALHAQVSTDNTGTAETAKTDTGSTDGVRESGRGRKTAEPASDEKGTGEVRPERGTDESEVGSRKFARSMTKHLMDIADVPYDKQSFEKWEDFANSVIADKGIDGAMDVWRKMSGKDNEGRKTALGVVIAKELRDAGRDGDYRIFGEELVNAVGNAAQELAAAKMLSRLNPDFAPIHGDKITKKAHNRPQTPEEYEKTQRLAEELKDAADREMLAKEGIEAAEQRIKNLEQQNAELEKLLEGEKRRGKDTTSLEKALKAAKASAAYYKALVEEKRRNTPNAPRTTAQIKKFKEKVAANRSDYMKRIRDAFQSGVLRMAAGDGNLRQAAPVDIDPELLEALTDLSAEKILDGLESGLTPEQFNKWLDRLTNNSLTEYEKAYVHAMGFNQIRSHKSLTPEAKAKLKTRYMHARVANQILQAEERAARAAANEAIKNADAFKYDKFARLMVDTAEKIDASDEAIFVASLIRNYRDMARIKDAYAEAGYKDFDKHFVEAKNLIEFTKSELETARIEGREGIDNISKNELNRFKGQERIARKEKFIKLKEIDNHYKELTRSAAKKTIFGILDGWNLVRAVMFSMDAGFALAQGGPRMITNPKGWFRAMKKGIPAAAETPALNRWLRKAKVITEDQGVGDWFRKMPAIDAGLNKLGFTGDKFMDAVVNAAESEYRARSEAQGVKYETIGATQDWNESIMSKLSEKIPLVRQSNLAHSLVTDLFRLNQSERYLKWLDDMEARGKIDAFQRNRAEEFLMKKWVNVMTGKGYLGPLDNFAWAAAQLMSAPRYTASAFQALYYSNPARIPFVPKGARAMVAQDAAKLYGTGAALIFLLGALGWMNLDPEDKDFLVLDANKIPGLKNIAPDMKIALVRWLKEPFRLTVGLGLKYAIYQAMGNQDAADRIEKQWFNEFIASDFGGIGNYWRGRMHPAISMIRTNVTGENFVGDPVGWEDPEEYLPLPLTIKETLGALKYDRRESILKSGKANPNPSENVQRMLLSVIANGIGLGVNSYPSAETTVAGKQARAMMGSGGDSRTDAEKESSKIANQLERAIREGYDVTEELTSALSKGQINEKQAKNLQAQFKDEIAKFQRDFGVRLTDEQKQLLMSHRRAFKILDYLWGKGFQIDRDKVERTLEFATPGENYLNDRAAQAEAEAIILRSLLRSKKTSKPSKAKEKAVLEKITGPESQFWDVDNFAQVYEDAQKGHSELTDSEKQLLLREIKKRTINANLKGKLQQETLDRVKRLDPTFKLTLRKK